MRPSPNCSMMTFFYLFCYCFETTHELHFAHFSFVKKKFFVFHSSIETCSDNWEFSSKDTHTPQCSILLVREWEWALGMRLSSLGSLWQSPIHCISISDVNRDRDKQLWGKITDSQCLKDLLPEVNVQIDHFVNVAMITYYHAFVRSTSSVVLKYMSF